MTEQHGTIGDVSLDATQVVETPAPLETVSQPSGAPKASRTRWALALGGAAVVVAITAAIVFALVGKSPDASVLGYVPSGSIMYGELRLDLPGDQQRKVGEFLSKFPGFADQAALESKIDETLDRFISEASKDKQTYTKDIKPWFGGELAFAVGQLPDAATLSGSATKPEFHGLALLSIKDATLAKAWFDAALKESGATTTTEAYNGATLTLSSGDGQQGAFTIIDGKVAVIGDVATVRQAVDTKGAGGFASEADPKAALAAADSDHIGLVYLALKPIMDWSSAIQKQMGDQLGGAGMASSSALSESMMKLLPAWEAYWVRADGDAMVLEAVLPMPDGLPKPGASRANAALKHVPSGAIVAIASNDLGKGLLDGWKLYKAEPSLKDIVDQVEKAADLAGGIDAIVGWMGDTALVVDRTDTSAEGGLVSVPADADGARHLLTSLKSAIGLAGGGQVTVREEDHNGVTITIVDAGDIGALAGSGMAQLPPGFKLPSGHVELAWAATDGVVVLGSGPDFVKHVLDTTEATSLAADARFKALVDRAGTGNGAYFVDIAAIRAMSEGLAADLGVDLGKYKTDVQPYLAPFDALYATGSVEGDLTHSNVIITVK